MTAAQSVYLQLQRVARERKRPADEISTLYGLERFLARLADTPYAEDFCLKGGVLLSAHALRRPTRDIDMQALDFQLDVDHVTEVVKAVCDVVVDDGLTFDGAAMQIEQIRDEDEYSGLRCWAGRELPSSSISVDVAVLSDRFEFGAADLREAAVQVATRRGAELRPLRALMDGYGAIGQAKWAAWRRKLKMEDPCEQDLDEQVERVLTFIEPVFDGSAEDHHRRSPDAHSWS